jgi:hypothetical protein
MPGTPVTQNDVESVRDVPIEEALAYLEVLERERRGLLKAGVILRGVQRAKIQQADAEREAARLQKQNTEATAALRELLARVVAERTRLDGLVVEVGETERRLGDARHAADEEEVAIERRLSERRADADRALDELERTHRERRGALEAEESALVSKIQVLRDELRGVAAKAGAL